MKLLGKYVLQDYGESYITGRIVGVIEECSFFVVQPDDMAKRNFTPPMMICEIETMIEKLNDGRQVWNLFNSRRDLNRFLKWLDTPTADKTIGNVVPMRKEPPPSL